MQGLSTPGGSRGGGGSGGLCGGAAHLAVAVAQSNPLPSSSPILGAPRQWGGSQGRLAEEQGLQGCSSATPPAPAVCLADPRASKLTADPPLPYPPSPAPPGWASPAAAPRASPPGPPQKKHRSPQQPVPGGEEAGGGVGGEWL